MTISDTAGNKLKALLELVKNRGKAVRIYIAGFG
jgi:Fe-S cluster assembly iron-binding protein IscA